jgi:type IV pilus assembly protein PilE
MEFKRKFAGFTLVELLVAMAIIAVLIGLAVGAISIAQRVSRDNERRSAVQEITANLNAYYASNASYPIRGTGSNNVRRSGNNISVASLVVQLRGAAIASGSTSSNGTRFCYARTTGGYVVGAQLEDGSYYVDQSTDRTVDQVATCTTNFL